MDQTVAIVGMSCRVPGANSTAELFESLMSSQDLRSEISRFNIAGYYHQHGNKRKGLTNVRHAYFLKDNVSHFDNDFFSLSPHEARAIDPQQRLLLEVSYEAVENAGVPLQSFRGSNTAVFSGLFTSDYLNSALRDIDHLPTYLSTGSSNSMGANRISYFFDLHGPSMTIDTACSSTLVALHQAVQSLKSRESDMALVCGANLILNPDMFLHMSDLGFLSPDGRCHSFDAKANGYARGEGVISLLLKPLDAAIRDGNPVRAIVRGSRLNQDGRTNGLTYPSCEAQTDNIKSLYRDINLNPDDVQYFEAHGTGTPVGDPVEMNAIRSVFLTEKRPNNLIVGSIKSNVGHLEACAALAGIIKTIECLERGKIPPQMHFSRPNPSINFEQLTVPVDKMQWPSDQQEVSVAAVNSFGFGGTNGHVVLQRPERKNVASVDSQPRAFLFKLSAASDYSLQKVLSDITTFVAKARPKLTDLAHTLLAHRSTLAKTCFVIASSHQELATKLQSDSLAVKSSQREMHQRATKIGFTFTGQGAHWVGMGQQMLRMSRIFAAVVDKCDEVLKALTDAPDWRIHDELLRDTGSSRIHVSKISQPACTALQLGMIELWRSWGLKPSFAVGHSSGEIAAAYASGLISLSDAIVIAYYRGKFLGAVPQGSAITQKGSMCAVALGEAKCRQIVKEFDRRIALAAVNSPTSCTLSGDEDCIAEIVQDCKRRGILCKKLPVEMAYHSHHMIPHAALYREALVNAQLAKTSACEAVPSCSMFSSVLARKVSGKDLDANYWVNNMVSTVQYSAAISEALISHQVDAIVEVGPHPALKGPTTEVYSSIYQTEVSYHGTSVRNRPDFESALESVSELHLLGCSMAFDMVNAEETNCGEVQLTRGNVLTDLPSYPWDHRSSHWSETRVSHNQRSRQTARHELLGSRVPYDNDLDMKWRNMLSFKEVTWLSDLYDQGCSDLPPFAFVYMAMEALRQISFSDDTGARQVQLSNLIFPEALPLSPLKTSGSNIEIHFSLQRKSTSNDFSFTITALGAQHQQPEHAQTWLQHCTGDASIVLETNKYVNGAATSAVTRIEDRGSVENFNKFPMNPNVTEFQVGSSQSSGSFSIKDEHTNDLYPVHPSFLAWLCRMQFALATRSNPSAIQRCTSIDRITAPHHAYPFQAGRFSISCDSVSRLGSSSTINVSSELCHLRLQGIKLGLKRLEDIEPAMALFYQPKILPDISTAAETFEEWHLDQLMELLLHKWTLCDIALTEMFEDVSNSLDKYCRRERISPRSIQIKTQSNAESNWNRIRYVSEFFPSQTFHLVFAKPDDLPSVLDHVDPSSFICLQTSQPESSTLQVLGRISGICDQQWFLTKLRRSEPSHPEPPPSAITGCEILVNSPLDTPAFGNFDSMNFIDKSGVLTTPISVFATDCNAKGLIMFDYTSDCTWLQRWNTTLATLQSEIESIRTLLWVSFRPRSQPLSAPTVIGSFIRSLKAEYPMLKASSLAYYYSESHSDNPAETIMEIFRSIDAGIQRDTELFHKDGKLFILRYRSDDRLASAVGCDPPQMFSGAPKGKYEVGVIAPHKASLITRHLLEEPSFDTDFEIEVFASTIGLGDARTFAASSGPSEEQPGHFYAGTVRRAPENHTIRNGTFVVGWHRGTYSSKVFTTDCQLLALPGCADITDALVRIASSTIASCILDDIVRIRDGDVVVVNVSGPLGTALAMAAGKVQKTTCSKVSKPDFTVSYSGESGLQLNGRNVTNTILKRIHRPIMPTALASTSHCPNVIKSFDLAHSQEAFEFAVQTPIGPVLFHEAVESAHEHLIEKAFSPQRFRADGAYVIIGGLGGLGRELCRWMAHTGARHLVLMSRSAMMSTTVDGFIAELKTLGTDLKLFQVDARNNQAVASALAKVRQSKPILGCFNLAMVLADSPFERMQAGQWDLAVSTKVDSSWVLHRETLDDQLEFFIMASSVTCVTGNRAQANYAVGNAFQVALAEDRRRAGLSGVALALGPVKDSGTLSDDSALLETLQRTALRALNVEEFLIAMDAAVIESQPQGQAFIGTGIQTLEAVNGIIQSDKDISQSFLSQWPEFGSLIKHKLDSTHDTQHLTLLEDLKSKSQEAILPTILTAFCKALGGIMGYDDSKIDPSKPLTAFGLDSLNAIACRFWFSKELEIDIQLFQILGSRSINDLMSHALAKFNHSLHAEKPDSLPRPFHHSNISGARPASHAQRRLWFLQQLVPDKTLHNLLLVCHIEGTVKQGIFRDTWSHLLRRHEVLTAQFVNTSEGLQYIPQSCAMFILEKVQVEAEQFDDKYTEIRDVARHYEFNLEKGELVRGWLLTSQQRSAFFLASHHIAWDRSSAPTVFGEAVSIYRCLVNGEDPTSKIDSPKFQYVDYTLWHENLAKSGALEVHLDYWKKQLQGSPEAVTLFPFSRVLERPAVKQYAYDSITFTLDRTTTSQLKTFCNSSAVTPFMFMTAVTVSLIHLLTGDEDIVIGIVDGDRGHPDLESLVGFMVNMLPIRLSVSDKQTFGQLLEHLRAVCVDAYEHHFTPLDTLLQHLNIPRRTSHSLLFQVIINYQTQGSFPESDFGDFKFVGYDHYNARSQADFALDIEELPSGSITCDLSFDSDIYSKSEMQHFSRIIQTFIRRMMTADEQVNLKDISILPPEDQSFVEKILRSPADIELRPKTMVPETFSEIAVVRSTHAAVLDSERAMTYRELDTASNRVANALISQGLQVGDCVMLSSEPCVEMIVGLYGILKAGGVYVPIDPAYPVNRIESMVVDTDAERILVHHLSSAFQEKLILCGFLKDSILDITLLAGDERDGRASQPSRAINVSDICCCIFTSGTTGRPKGIKVGHEQVFLVMRAYHEFVNSLPSDRFVLTSSLTFDASFAAIFGALLYGGTLYVASREECFSPASMVDLLVDQSISYCAFTPTQMQMLLHAKNSEKLRQWHSLRTMTLCGERLPPELLKSIFSLGLPKAVISQGYGPTETTMGNSFRVLSEKDCEKSFVPLGGPIAPARFYILDSRGKEVPVGVAGELYIGGPTVNAGYLNREEATQDAFLKDPSATPVEIFNGHDRLYRTGDLCRLLWQGSIEILGRIGGDRQVKIRGIRTALTEIESVIWNTLASSDEVEQPLISQVAVIYHQTLGSLHGVLAAYLVPTAITANDKDLQQTCKSLARSRIKANLPQHMMPGVIRFAESLPLMVSGKTDYKTMTSWPIPEPDIDIPTDVVPSAEGGLSSIEAQVSEIWSRILGTRANFAPEHDFFTVGGHSLILIQFQDEVEKIYDVSVALVDLFAHSTVRGMAMLIESSLERQHLHQLTNGDRPRVDVPVNGVAPFSELADWEAEIKLSETTSGTLTPAVQLVPSRVVGITGACTMGGAYFIAHALNDMGMTVHSLATEGACDVEARDNVVAGLKHWQLLDTIGKDTLRDKLVVHCGGLDQPSLGLSKSALSTIVTQVDTFYLLAADVSLLKRYDSLRASNVGSLRFLIDCALNPAHPKRVAYLSTWGVPHLQSFRETKTVQDPWRNGEVELGDMEPPVHGPGYLKARWVCEQLLASAAAKGASVHIFRACMCGSSTPGVALPRQDINRRILEESVRVGMVPNFQSEKGGGMSWVSADFVVRGMTHLAEKTLPTPRKPAIHHLVSDVHMTYDQLPQVLEAAFKGRKVRSVQPTEWFAALKAIGSAELRMDIEVLEQWWSSGWVPFGLAHAETLATLREAGIEPPAWNDGVFIRDNVVGVAALQES